MEIDKMTLSVTAIVKLESSALPFSAGIAAADADTGRFLALFSQLSLTIALLPGLLFLFAPSSADQAVVVEAIP